MKITMKRGVKTLFENIHPGFIFILVGFIAIFVPKSLRGCVLVLGPAVALAASVSTPLGVDFESNISLLPFMKDYTIQYFYLDALSWFFTFIFCIMGLIGGMFAMHNKGKLEALCSMMYVGASIGVVLSHDWITFLFFWEMEAAASLFLIWEDERDSSNSAGFRYILMHTLSGSAILFGVVIKLVNNDTMIFNLAEGKHDAAFWAILFGVLINVAAIPFHSWLTDGYSSATLTGSVFMSSYTTKVAVYALLRVFGGNELLITVGVIMALYGALYAVMENDMIKLLSYHIISQVGYMVCGAGIGTVMSMQGAASHAFCDILFKSLLFMCCNAIIYATGVRHINQLGGMARRYPFVCACFIVGGFSIAGMPLFNGFVSKMMTIAAAEEMHMEAVALLLEVASVGTLLSICFKMLYFIFLAPDKGIAVEKRPILPNMKIAMGVGAVLCILTGSFPNYFYKILPFGSVAYVPYTAQTVGNQLVMLFVAVIPFLLFLPKMEPHTAISLDFDWFYRKPIRASLYGLSGLCIGLCRGLGDAWGVGVHMIMDTLDNPMKLLDARPFRIKKRYTPENYRTSIADPIMIILTVLFICIFYFRTSY